MSTDKQRGEEVALKIFTDKADFNDLTQLRELRMMAERIEELERQVVWLTRYVRDKSGDIEKAVEQAAATHKHAVEGIDYLAARIVNLAGIVSRVEREAQERAKPQEAAPVTIIELSLQVYKLVEDHTWVRGLDPDEHDFDSEAVCDICDGESGETHEDATYEWREDHVWQHLRDGSLDLYGNVIKEKASA